MKAQTAREPAAAMTRAGLDVAVDDDVDDADDEDEFGNATAAAAAAAAVAAAGVALTALVAFGSCCPASGAAARTS